MATFRQERRQRQAQARQQTTPVVAYPIDWEQEEDQAPQQMPRNFVAPGPSTAITPRRVDILPPVNPSEGLPEVAQVRSVTTGSHSDRALGFRIRMLPVAVVAGLLGAIAGASLFGVPWLSFALLLWFFTVFCATWLGGYLLDLAFSADGVALFTVLGGLRMASREQKARLRRMDREG